MVKIKLSKKDLYEILNDISNNKGSCPSNWGLEDPDCHGDCIDCVIDTVLKNTEEL